MRSLYVSLTMVCFTAVVVESVRVKPALCPTNKIAPYKRISDEEYLRRREESARTFGAFYDLLAPNGLANDEPSSLQEKPQEDDANDCGDIEDYDENDLSSLTPQNRRYYDTLYFFGNSNRRPLPPPTYRPRPDRYPQQRPPSGGYFGGNAYRPPAEYRPPSHEVKPVHEELNEPTVTYKPGLLVGAPVPQIVGMTTNVPSEPEPVEPSTRRPTRFFIPNNRPLYQPIYPTRPSRPRYMNNDQSIIGSFMSLFFK